MAEEVKWTDEQQFYRYVDFQCGEESETIV